MTEHERSNRRLNVVIILLFILIFGLAIGLSASAARAVGVPSLGDIKGAGKAVAALPHGVKKAFEKEDSNE